MSTPQLDSNTIGDLKYLHRNREEGLQNELYALVRSLRAAGWPLASISPVLGVSRETPRNWERKAIELELPLVPVPAPIRPRGSEAMKQESARVAREERLRREKAALETNLPRLRALQPKAEALRGPSRFSPDYAAASAEYTRLINETLRGGCRARVLAEELDIAEITIHARLRRSGLRKTAPSEKVPSWATPGWAESA